MNKIVMMLVAVACVFGVRSEDSYIYWMIDENLELDRGSYDVPNGYSARVSAYDATTGAWSSDYMALWTAADDGSLASAGTSVDLGPLGSTFYSALSTNLSGDDWNYYVEIWSNEGNMVGRSENYATAQAAGYIRSGNLMPGIYMTVSSFSSPVPEPTSGLLMLIGSAALALRRRKIRV